MPKSPNDTPASSEPPRRFAGRAVGTPCFVTVDRLGGLPVDAAFETEIRRHLERFRMAGCDLEIDGPRFVSLDVEVQVCVRPDYFRSSVKAALLEVFSNRDLPDGRRGVFHPDNFSLWPAGVSQSPGRGRAAGGRRRSGAA